MPCCQGITCPRSEPAGVPDALENLLIPWIATIVFDLCADAGHQPAGVTAVEAFPPMAALAEAVIETNGLGNLVNVINKHSSDLTVSLSRSSGTHLQSSSALCIKADMEALML